MDIPNKKETADTLKFIPPMPESLEALGIPDTMVEALVLRRIYTSGTSSLKALSRELKLSYSVIQTIFERLRKEQFFEIKGMQGRDYTFTLSVKGQEFARKSYDICRYNGPAPVSLEAYGNAVSAQSGDIRINRAKLEHLFCDLVLTQKMLNQLGPALISQNSIFLYGPTGNGKTSLASRFMRVYRDFVAVPYAVEFDRQIIVVYDPVFHKRADEDVPGTDPRWVLCRRPCVMVGGELTASMLELKVDQNTGVYAAPIQMKANNGMLIIDDFGRQMLSPEDLLNRWIVPLDRKVDFLSLSYGVKFEIPFQMTVVFSTNIDPSQLADEAFLRRIQNKIYVGPVPARNFDRIFNRIVQEKGFHCEPDSPVLLRKLCNHFAGKELRACYPADIVNIIESISTYEETPVAINRTNLKRAANIYFTQTVNLPIRQALN
jgi:DNA-binding MarR family transcriptional regulator